MMDNCFLCGKHAFLEKHHIFGGPNRKLSEQDGLFVYLCHQCHNEPPYGVHFNKARMDSLRAIGQDWYEQKQITEGMNPEEARAAFMARYGKNYI